MDWKTIRLELAGTVDFPAGSVSRGYLIRVPLNDDGLIDEQSLAAAPKRATVRRFWSTEPDESGLVVRAHGRWTLRCVGKPDRPMLSNKPFGVGEQIAIVDSDGSPLPFRVSSIRLL